MGCCLSSVAHDADVVADSPHPHGDDDATAFENAGLESETAKAIYGKRLYHGSTTDGVASLRSDGFQLARKGPGATSGRVTGTLPPNAPHHFHHYLTTEKTLAQKYDENASAPANGPGLKPALARVIPERGAVLEQDPSTYPPSPAILRTPNDISAARVLGPKGHLSDANVAVFRQYLARENVRVSDSRARELLDGEQSDSDGDF